MKQTCISCGKPCNSISCSSKCHNNWMRRRRYKQKKMEIKYRTFRIPKRTGGARVIEQPIDGGLEILQDKLKDIEKIKGLKPSYFAHSFMHGRNIVTCARQHFGKKFIARIDIKDFFGSITYDNFKKVVFPKRSIEITKIDNVDEIMESIQICFKDDGKGKLYLPQGSPTSPFLSNAYMRNFDWKMAWYCYERGVTYSRYADDIYLSTDKQDKTFWSCIHCVVNSFKGIYLKENKKKRKVMKAGMRMNVVGVVCNEKFQVNKKTRKIIRAILHNASKSGEELTSEQKGLINFRDMVANYKSEVESNLEVCRGLAVINAI